MSGPNPRAAAVAALVRQEQDGFSNLILDAELRRQKLEDCVDEIRNRFGKRAIFSAALMGELNMPDDGRHEVTMPGMMYS